MTDRPSWETIATYGDSTAAELAAGRLKAVGIPSRIDRRGAVGLFGLGHSGKSVRGIALLVPSTALEQAREALDLTEERL